MLAALAAIAPEADLARLAPDQPLRDQIDLDSLDWVNLLAGMTAPVAASPQATLDELVAALAASWLGAPASGLAPMPAGVVLRELCAADAPLEAAFVRTLSEQARYMRFMGSLRELPRDKLAFLTDVDQVRHVALAAVLADAKPPRMIAEARYVVDADGPGCEFALAIADDCQHTGLAGRMMHALMARARDAGLKHMRGEILASNQPMLRFVRELGFSVAPAPDDPHTMQARRRL